MAPITRNGSSKATTRSIKPTGTQYNNTKKKRQQQLVKPKISHDQNKAALMVDDICSAAATSPCSTPKAQKFRIPKIETCPPAPKKQRLIFSDCSSSSSSLQRSSTSTPIAFFAPPDLELFFFTHRDIPI